MIPKSILLYFITAMCRKCVLPPELTLVMGISLCYTETMENQKKEWMAERQLTKITRLLKLGTGVRVELDFIDALSEEEGILIGNTCKGFVKAMSENREVDTYPRRVFRVNAGALHQLSLIHISGGGGSRLRLRKGAGSGKSVLLYILLPWGGI